MMGGVDATHQKRGVNDGKGMSERRRALKGHDVDISPISSSWLSSCQGPAWSGSIDRRREGPTPIAERGQLDKLMDVVV